MLDQVRLKNKYTYKYKYKCQYGLHTQSHLFAGGRLSSGVSPRLASGDPGPAISLTPGAFGDFGFGDDIIVPIYLGPSLTGWLVLSSRGRNISLHHCAVRTRI